MGKEHKYNIMGIIMQPFFRNTLFEGIIRCQENGNFRGELTDVRGKSRIEGILKNHEGEMYFRKQYFARNDSIFYLFRKQGNLWVGVYMGVGVEIGEAQCEIFEKNQVIDWNRRVFTEMFSTETAEANSRYLIEKMVQEGFLKRVKDSETGEEMLSLTDKAKRFDINHYEN